MPAYRDSFNDEQVAELVSYLRQPFAAGKPAWQDVTASVARIRPNSRDLTGPVNGSVRPH
jgi:nicotinate dehydrogenase subunit B